MNSGLLYLYDFINRLSDEKSSFNSIYFRGIIEVQSYLRSFRIIPSLSDGCVFVYDESSCGHAPGWESYLTELCFLNICNLHILTVCREVRS